MTIRLQAVIRCNTIFPQASGHTRRCHGRRVHRDEDLEQALREALSSGWKATGDGHQCPECVVREAARARLEKLRQTLKKAPADQLAKLVESAGRLVGSREVLGYGWVYAHELSAGPRPLGHAHRDKLIADVRAGIDHWAEALRQGGDVSAAVRALWLYRDMLDQTKENAP